MMYNYENFSCRYGLCGVASSCFALTPFGRLSMFSPFGVRATPTATTFLFLIFASRPATGAYPLPSAAAKQIHLKIAMLFSIFISHFQKPMQ
jgi:hypothetical protein